MKANNLSNYESTEFDDSTSFGHARDSIPINANKTINATNEQIVINKQNEPWNNIARAFERKQTELKEHLQEFAKKPNANIVFVERFEKGLKISTHVICFE